MLGLERESNEILLNAENGYLTTTKGVNAVEGAKATSEALRKVQEKYGANLDTLARNAYDKSSGALSNRHHSSILQHSAKGQQDREDQNRRSQLEISTENLIQYSGDPAVYKVTKQVIYATSLEGAKDSGLEEAAAKEVAETAVSNAVARSLDAAILTDPLTAQTLFEREGVKDALEPGVREKYAKKIKEGMRAQTGICYDC
jgi:hypothetical protein